MAREFRVRMESRQWMCILESARRFNLIAADRDAGGEHYIHAAYVRTRECGYGARIGSIETRAHAT